MAITTGHEFIGGELVTAAKLNTAVTGLSVTATGSTTARSPSDRAAEVANVLDFGADASGTTECSSEVQAAWDSIKTKNGILLFPAGTYKLNTALDFRTDYTPSAPDKHNHSISGYGATLDFSSTSATSGSLIKWGAVSSSQVEESSRYNLEGFQIVGPHTGNPDRNTTAATSLIGLELLNAYGLSIKNVGVRHVYKGLHVRQCFPIDAENLIVASSFIGVHVSTNCTFGTWANCTFKKGRFGIVIQPHDEDSAVYGQRFSQIDLSENQVGVVLDPLNDDDAGTDVAIYDLEFHGLYMEAVVYDGVRIGRAWDASDAATTGADRTRVVTNIRITGGMWVNSVVWGSVSTHQAVLLHADNSSEAPAGLLIDIPVQTPTSPAADPPTYSRKSQIISRLDPSIGMSSTVAETNDVIQNKIQFPSSPVADTDANALDDYEEGTYTPIVGNVTIGTGGKITGYYTKVGRLVTASFNIVLGSSSSVGAMYISLPVPGGDSDYFDAPEVSMGHGTATDASEGNAKYNIMFNRFTTTATAVIPYAGTTAVSASNPMTWASGDTISGTITYFV